MKEHLLQSEVWGKYEEMEGHEVTLIEGECEINSAGEGSEKSEAQVEKGGKKSEVQAEKGKKAAYRAVVWTQETPFGKYWMAGYGPCVDKAGLKCAVEGIRKGAERAGVLFVRMEPTFPLTLAEGAEMGLKKVKNIDPEHTWVLDLEDKTEDEILAGMESRKVRYWRNHEKKGMRIRQTKDPEQIEILTKMLSGLGERDHFTPQSEEHLKNQLKAGFATLYVVDLAGNTGEGAVEKSDKSVEKSENVVEKSEKVVPIAAAIVYDYAGVRYYAHAATDDEHRKMMAGTILLIQMILDAKKQGMKTYDFWGMTPSEDPKHPWYGFTQYKKSFGGRQVDYAGTWDLVIKPAKYKMYEGLRKANLALRKMRK